LGIGVNYLDSGFGVETVLAELDNEFKDKGLLAIANVYYSPGADTILAHYAIERLNSIDSVDFRWSIVDIVPSSEHSRQLYWGFTLEGMLLHHYTSPAKRVENGKLMELPSRSDPETFTLKGPIGKTLVDDMTDAILVYIHQYFPDIPNVTFKEVLCIAFNEKGNFLAKLGLCQTGPINIGGKMVSPWAVLATVANDIKRHCHVRKMSYHGSSRFFRAPIRDSMVIAARVRV